MSEILQFESHPLHFKLIKLRQNFTHEKALFLCTVPQAVSVVIRRVQPEQLEVKKCMSFISMASKFLWLLTEFIATSAFHSHLVLPQM